MSEEETAEFSDELEYEILEEEEAEEQGPKTGMDRVAEIRHQIEILNLVMSLRAIGIEKTVPDSVEPQIEQMFFDKVARVAALSKHIEKANLESAEILAGVSSGLKFLVRHADYMTGVKHFGTPERKRAYEKIRQQLRFLAKLRAKKTGCTIAISYEIEVIRRMFHVEHVEKFLSCKGFAQNPRVYEPEGKQLSAYQLVIQQVIIQESRKNSTKAGKVDDRYPEPVKVKITRKRRPYKAKLYGEEN